MLDDWIEVAWLEPTTQGDNRSSEVNAVLDAWLRDRGTMRDKVADDDIRIDLVYVGPERGAWHTRSLTWANCGTRVLVRRGVGGT